jgi:small-conductance mechanosensitive channel
MPNVVHLIAAFMRHCRGLALLTLAILAPLPVQATDPAVPPNVKEFMRLLADPAIQQWIRDTAPASQPAEAAPAAAPDAPPAAAAVRPAPQAGQGFMTAFVEKIRLHVSALRDVAPLLPGEFQRVARQLQTEVAQVGLLGIVVLIGAFVALGAGAEWLVWQMTAPARTRILALDLSTLQNRLLALVMRLAIGLGLVAAFALGTVGAFLAFTWPPLLREIVLSYLTAVVGIRLVAVICRLPLAPPWRHIKDVRRFRVIPVTDATAAFWYRRLLFAAGFFLLGFATVALLRTLDVPQPGRALVAYILGLGLLAIAIETTWRRPVWPEGKDPWVDAPQRAGAQAINYPIIAGLVLLWLLWVLSAMSIFWTLVIAAMLPVVVILTRRSIEHVVRPDTSGTLASPVTVCIERGSRALIIMLAAFLFAKAWGFDLVDIGTSDSIPTRLARGLLQALIVILIGDFIWNLLKNLIDRKMMASAIEAGETDLLRQRQQRLRTLLPIARNLLFVLLLVMTLLMALSSLGIEIAPLIAGAGVVGVAIGFGSQTLVKDIISGVFYLLDDAFRVGEYIQSGNHKGVVESFSLRSVKLRHHRGPLYTIPFGSLGAIQNMSRDWVIDKMTINITYDTDLEKARKLIKQIGKDLAADPEMGPNILEPLKMQGVEQFGELGMLIRLKMKTKPGQQFVIRRKAFAAIKKAFDAHDIHFALPMVQVSGSGPAADDASTAAAIEQRNRLRDAAAANPNAA